MGGLKNLGGWWLRENEKMRVDLEPDLKRDGEKSWGFSGHFEKSFISNYRTPAD